MSCRYWILTGLPLLLLLCQGGLVRAHDLRVVYDVLPGRQIRVKCFYTNVLFGPSPAHRTEVEIKRAGRDPIKGTSDEEGKFTFTYDKAEDLTIVARAPGHVSRPVTIEASELEGSAGNDPKSSVAEPADSNSSGSSGAASSARLEEKAEQAGRQLLKDMLLGLSLIFAVAAFVMSMRNAKELREIRKLLEERELANRS